MKKIKNISIKIKLIFVVELCVILIAVTLGVFSYRIQNVLVRNASKEKLLTVASSVAAIIDPEKLVLI